MDLLLPAIAVLGGFVALVWSADRFVDAAAVLAKILGVSPLVIGLTVVAFGTSAPELVVSAVASTSGAQGISVGNALGSNIVNIALVLGISALVAPLRVSRRIVVKELPLLMGIMAASYLLLRDGDLSMIDGVAFGLGLLAYIGVSTWKGVASEDPPEELVPEIPKMTSKAAVTWLLVGLVFLTGGAELVVWGGTSLAEYFGVNELIVGLTVVAFGTSLPELAACIASARKNEHDITLGNVIGSNVFNILGVLCLPGILAPGPIEGDAMIRDYPVMAFFTVILLPWHGRRD